jgi:hypothetical protein
MQENTFKTKTGFCHVLPDKIVISRDGIVGNVAKRVVGNTISRILMVYGSLAMFLAYAAIKDYQEGESFLV